MIFGKPGQRGRKRHLEWQTEMKYPTILQKGYRVDYAIDQKEERRRKIGREYVF